VSNTDDFIFRLLKGCLQLKLAPTLHNTLNMVPVDYAARIITASAFHAGPDTPVVHVTGRPCSTFDQVFSALNEFGFDVDMTDYNAWCGVLRRDFAQNSTNALYPLQHFVLDNLQQRLQAPILDNRNAAALLLADRDWTGEDLTARNSVTTEDIGKYLAYLVCIGFLDAPTKPAATALPSVPLDLVALKSKHVGGRGGHG
jgi:L-aminoadipate-semialdehyde dehydrogenase